MPILPVNITFSVLDASNNTAITQALIYVDGQYQISTGSLGLIKLSLLPALYELTVIKSGYTNVLQSFRVINDDTIVISMQPTIVAAPLTSFNVNLSGASDGSNALVTLAPDSGPSSSIAADGFGNARFMIPAGSYALTVSKPGYQDISQSVTVLPNTNASIAVTMIALSDDAGANNPALPAQTSTITTPPAVIPQSADSLQPPEYIYPNSPDGLYFTATQARMYIGNLFIDELNTVQWTGQLNRIPIYSYRASLFDAVGRGKSLIQGQLAINLISEGYLIIALQQFQKMVAPPKTSVSHVISGGDTQASIDAATALEAEALQTDKNIIQLNTAANANQLQSSTASPVNTTITALQKRRDTIIAGSDPSLVDSIKQNRTQFMGNVPAVGAGYKNAIYLGGPFDIEVDLEGGGRTVTRRLGGCFLTGNDVVMDQSGSVLLDVYSFIAREIR